MCLAEPAANKIDTASIEANDTANPGFPPNISKKKFPDFYPDLDTNF